MTRRFNAMERCRRKPRADAERKALRKDLERMWGVGRAEARAEMLRNLEEWFLEAVASAPRGEFARRLAGWIEEERRKA